MAKKILCIMIILVGVFGISCSKATRISTSKSSDKDIYFTIETYEGRGAIDSDYTNIYAHFIHNDSKAKALVLSGTNLTVASVNWVNPRDVVICIDGGYTDTFRNNVTLRTGGASETIHSYLQENCKTAPTASPASK